MFHTHQGNRLEALTDQLAEWLRRPVRAPLAHEIIVTQSNGVARWLSLQLANRLGICANFDFQFPATFLWEISRAVLRWLPPTSAFDRSVLRWRVMALLKDVTGEPCFAPVRAWLGDGNDDFRRHELACRIADCFDQYLIYRPDWSMQWEEGQEDHWQAELWRRLARGDEMHRTRVQNQLCAALQRGQVDQCLLPERVAVVGVSALPPLYLHLLAELARYIDVHLFLLNPCREYWGDIRAERDLARLGGDIDPEAEYLTVGNPLLASLGKQGRDFIDLLLGYPCIESKHFVEPESGDLLHCVQADILHLRERGTDEHPPLPLHPDDRSLQVHVCHGPMREVEVLHDQLLALFETYRDLRPSDVIVMAPDIARYGPLIASVFDTVPNERRIPFSVADQGLPVENPLVEVFFELLDLSNERFDAAQVLSLLEPPAVQRRFTLNEDDLERIRCWVRGVGIRWGIDAQTKDAWDLPATIEHTWRAGLDRLLLGYALPGQERDLYAGILPYDEIEGGEAQALGGMRRFLEALFGLHDWLRERQPLTDWIITLRTLLDRFFEPREREENELQLIRTALDTLGEHMELAQFTEPVSLAVVKSALRELLMVPESGAGRFLNGGVTCCAMVPMRSIPFAIVCLVGMNDDAYPRPHRPVGFDLMAGRFQRGDRSRRQDDRYLFLEILLSARRCLYLSYVGQNIRDNTVLPPSVLVSELLDVVDRGFQTVDGNPASTQLVTRHPLQAFSRRYFTGDRRLFSHAREWIEASRQAGRGELDAAPLLTSELPEPEPALRWVTLENLTRFFRNPARWLLRERLNIQVDESEEALETCEPFVLDGLENYQLLGRMLDLHREGRPVPEIETIMRASGALPHGQVGECLFAGASDRVTRFAGRLGRILPRRDSEPLEIDLNLGDFRLTGRLTGMTATGWVGYRLAKLKAADYLNLWLHHLALNAAAPEGVARQSHWVAEDQDILLDAVENPEASLRVLLDLYWQGSRRLLPFFPKSALAYVERLRKDKGDDPDKALWAAQRIWEGDERRAGSAEREDAYYQLAFGDADPLNGEFTALAMAIFGPLFEAIDANRSPSGENR